MVFGGRNCTGVLPPLSLSYLSSSIAFLLFLLTTAGNWLVCLAVYKDPNKELRTPFNFFIVNLAFTDLLVGLVVEPICVAVHMKESLTDEPLADDLTTFHMFYFISCTASVLSLTAITIDRYVAVIRPFYYRAKWNTKKVITASLVIWIISVSLPFVYFKVGYIGYSFVFATIVILTLVVLVFTTGRVFRKVRQQLEMSNRLYAGRSEVLARHRAHQIDARVTKVFLLVLVTYLLCYAPSCVMVYLMNFCTTCSCYSIHWLRDMHFLFALLNSCLNPFLYAWRLPSFRSAFGIITGLRRRNCANVAAQLTAVRNERHSKDSAKATNEKNAGDATNCVLEKTARNTNTNTLVEDQEVPCMRENKYDNKTRDSESCVDTRL